jgi:uncharacterized membrane protein
VALTGLSAFLYGQKHARREVTWFLFSRGLFLMILELTVVGFVVLCVVMYFPTRWFAKLKQRRKDIWWLKYL